MSYIYQLARGATLSYSWVITRMQLKMQFKRILNLISLDRLTKVVIDLRIDLLLYKFCIVCMH